MEANADENKSVTVELKSFISKFQSILNDNERLESSTTGAHHNGHRGLVAVLDDEMMGVSKTIFKDMIMGLSMALEDDGGLKVFLNSYTAFIMEDYSKTTELSTLMNGMEEFKIFGGGGTSTAGDIKDFCGVGSAVLCELFLYLTFLSVVFVIIAIPIIILLSPIWVPIAIYWFLICHVFDYQLPLCLVSSDYGDVNLL
jgi:hypothetical protein